MYDIENEKIESLSKDQINDMIRLLKNKGDNNKILKCTRDKDHYPIAPSQQRLWFLHELNPDCPFYNIPLQFTISGNFNVAVFEQTINKLIERHEIFRTKIINQSGFAFQKIQPYYVLNIKQVDISDLDKEDRLLKKEQFVLEQACLPFKLEEHPPIRVMTIRLSNYEHIAVIVFHHIIIDGWSVKIFLQELSSIYTSLVKHHQLNLAPLASQFLDFSEWQNKKITENYFSKQLDYWSEQLKENYSAFILPTNKNRSTLTSYSGSRYTEILSFELFDKLEKVAKKLNTTPFILCLTSLFILLYRYSNQVNINIGCPVPNRNLPELENTMGALMNTLVLNVCIHPEFSVEQTINQIKKNVYEAYQNQDIPFEKIVEKIQPERHLNHNPLFQVLFAYQNIDFPEINLPELDIEVKLISTNTSKVDLSFQMMRIKSGVELEVEFSTDLFYSATIKYMVEHFKSILIAVSEDIKQNITEINILTSQEKTQINEWNKTDKLFNSPLLLHELFSYQAQITPQQTALEIGSIKVSYEELDQLTNQFSSYLIGLGVGPETLVGIYYHRSIEMMVSILSILKAGGAYVPIGIDYPAERINFIITDSALTYLITSTDLMSNLMIDSCSKINILEYEKILPAIRNQNSLLRANVKPTNAAYVIYTSGSTGKPKGVINEHKGIVNYINARKNQFNVTNQDRFILKTPYIFDVSVWEMFLPLSMGATLCILEEGKHLDSYFLLNFIIESKISIIHFVPSMFDMFLQEKNIEQCKTLRQIYCSGEKLLLRHVEAFANKSHAQLINLYGPTEAAVDVTFWEYSHDKDITQIPIGKPLANIQIHILDNNLQSVPVGVIGQIHIGGIAVARGYLNRPTQTMDNFIADPFSHAEAKLYKTGDLGRYLPDGNVEMLGRIDDQVKIRGFRIELGEITAVVEKHPDVKQAIAIVHVDKKENKNIAIYFLPHLSKPNLITEIRAYLKEVLPPYMQPAFILKIDQIPLLPSGKINRKALPDPLNFNELEKESFIPPSNLIEEKLSIIWKDLLSVDKISISDNFFYLGGHSLLAIQLVARIQEEFTVHIPLQTILTFPTISQLANYINKESVTKQVKVSDSLLTLYKHINYDDHQTALPFPLNDVQQAYWVGKSVELELGNVGAHFYLEIDTHFVDPKLWNNAINFLIKRHDMLKAIVRADGKQQILEKVANYEIGFEDISNLSQQEADEVLNNKRKELSHKNYDTSHFPLFTFHLIKLVGNKARLFVSFDLIICDAHSLYIFFGELSQLLENLQTNFFPLNFSFRNYILFEERLKTSIEYQRSKNYWHTKLPTLPPAPALPMSKSPKLISSPRFKRYASFMLEKDWQQIKCIATEIGVTPSVLLLSVFSEVLHLWSNNKKFTINLTLFNRLPLHPDIGKIVGDFTTLNLLSIEQEYDKNFAERTALIQHTLWTDLEHRYYSGIQVLRDYAQQNNFDGAALMPIVFTSTLTQDSNLDASVIDRLGEIIYSISQTPQVYLDNQIYEYKNQLHFHWDVVEEIFPPTMIEAMFTAYCHFLNLLVIDKKILFAKNLPLIPPNQLHLFNQVNATTKPFTPTPLPANFLHYAQKHPDETAVITANETLSFGQLFNHSQQVSQWLIACTTKKNQQIAVLMKKSWVQIAAVMGILNVGFSYLPIDVDLPIERIQYLLNECDIQFIITIDTVADELKKFENIKYLIINETSHLDNIEPIYPLGTIDPYTLAYIIYTSGSTGMPKGVAITHAAAMNTIADINSRFSVNQNDKVLSVSSLNFDLSVYDIFGLLSAGGTVVIPDHDSVKDPAHLFELLHKNQVTIWNSVPILLELLIDYIIMTRKLLPASLRLILMSGDWIPLNLPDKIRSVTKHSIEIISLGGATEASIWSIFYPIHSIHPEWKSIPYGKPLANQKFYVLNDFLNDCPVWVTGNLYIEGFGLAKEYWKDSEKTHAQFIYHPVTGERLYSTGDLGRYLPDGNIEFIGRKDRQIKIRGYRIELQEIEKNLLKNENIKSVLVTLKLNQLKEKILVAYVIKNLNAEINETDLKKFLSAKIPNYMLPDAIIFLDNWPINKNGKIDIEALPAIVNREIPQPGDLDKEDKRNAEILSIVKMVLKQNDITAETNLLEYGATSVDVIRIANEIEVKYGFRIKFSDFYRNPSVQGLLANFLPTVQNNSSFNQENLNSYSLIYDLQEREKFKLQKKWHRSETNGRYVNLPIEQFSNIIKLKPHEFQAQRNFSSMLVSIEAISKMLSPIYHADSTNGNYYPSFGNLFAVQLYLYIKPDRVASLNSGIYYYDQLNHRLLFISEGKNITENLYVPFVYRPVFQNAAFALFMIVDFDAIGPMYGEESLRLSTLEAGYIGQLLMTSSALSGIALHPVGPSEFESVGNDFKLKPSQKFIHSLLGGLSQQNEMLVQWEYGEV